MQDMKEKNFVWIAALGLALLMAGCEQGAGIVAGTAQQEDVEEEPEWWEGWEEPEEEPEVVPVLTGISVGKKPNITLWGLGQKLEEGTGYWDGLTVLWDWSDGHHEQVADGEYTLKPAAVNTAGSGPVRITVTAGEYETDFSVYVSASGSVLTSISVTTAPSALYMGEPFNTGGMDITGTYNGGEQKSVQNSAVSVEGYDRYKRETQTVTLRVNNCTTTLDVRPRIKPGTKFWVNEYTYTSREHQTYEVKPAYIKGKDFDFAGSNVWAVFRISAGSPFDLTLTPGNGLYPEDIKGYDKNKAGRQELTLELDGVAAGNKFPVYVLDVKPDVWFDYGFMRHAGDPNGAGAGFGKYHVQQGKTLTLAPALYLIGWNDDHTKRTDTTYSWTVTGGGYDTSQPRNGEFFTFKPTAAGAYTVKVDVTGRNYVDGQRITKTATTQVVSFAPGTVGEKKTWGSGNNVKVLRNFAPGQYTKSGSGYGWSLGAIGGYAVWTDQHREVYGVAGNEFGTWFEPGIVWLQEDNNGNGVPDEMWYEIKNPNDLVDKYRPYITRRYANTWVDVERGVNGEVNGYGQTIKSICWADCRGRSGLLRGGWPSDWGVPDNSDWVTYTCTLIGDDGDISNGDYGEGIDHTKFGLYDETAGHWLGFVDAPHSAFYIDSAMDAAGNRVTLTNVRFVKAQTAVFVYGGIFGEISTEVGLLYNR
jgi:hypothetical protein